MLPIINNPWKPFPQTESRMTFCPLSSLRMCELSSKYTFTPLFTVDNAEPLTNILNLPLKIHLAFCENKCARLRHWLSRLSAAYYNHCSSLSGEHRQPVKLACLGTVVLLCAYYRKNTRIVLRIIIYPLNTTPN